MRLASYRACSTKEKHKAVIIGTCAQEFGYKDELNRALVILFKSLQMAKARKDVQRRQRKRGARPKASTQENRGCKRKAENKACSKQPKGQFIAAEKEAYQLLGVREIENKILLLDVLQRWKQALIEGENDKEIKQEIIPQCLKNLRGKGTVSCERKEAK